MKLTDTQLVLLSAAAQRQDGAVELGPKGSAFQKVIGKLLSEHLVEEIPAPGSLPVWRRDEDKGALALRITERGLDAIGAGQLGTAEVGQREHGAKVKSGQTPRRATVPASRPTRLGGSPSKAANLNRSRRR
jgi:hypothetical protein